MEAGARYNTSFSRLYKNGDKSESTGSFGSLVCLNARRVKAHGYK